VLENIFFVLVCLAFVAGIKDFAAQKFEKAQSERVNTSYHGVGQEKQEWLHVVEPHAVSNPHAVVVHPDNAPLALGAVVRPRRLHRFADSAHFLKLAQYDYKLVVREIAH